MVATTLIIVIIMYLSWAFGQSSIKQHVFEFRPSLPHLLRLSSFDLFLAIGEKNLPWECINSKHRSKKAISGIPLLL